LDQPSKGFLSALTSDERGDFRDGDVILEVAVGLADVVLSDLEARLEDVMEWIEQRSF
jgi:hypothetical protein